MHNVCPHSTLCALVSPGQMLHYKERETTASNHLLFQRAYMSMWWLCQNVKWHNFLKKQKETVHNFRSNDAMATRTSKNNRFNEQNNNFPCASHLSVHFFAIFARHIVKMPSVEFYGGRKQAMTSLDVFPRNSTPIWFAYKKWNSCDKDWKRLQNS